MSKLLFHGTSADCAKEILANGFSANAGGANWNVSGSAVYFWSREALEEMEEVDEADDDYLCASRGFDNARVALPRAKDCRAVIFEVSPDGLEIEADYSCDNMEGAVVCEGDVPASAIVGAWITDDLSFLRGVILGNLLNHHMAELGAYSAAELRIAKAMRGCECYDELDGLANLRRVTLDELREMLK